jgi:hypothetical protein
MAAVSGEDGLARLARRLGRCRRLLVVCGPGCYPAPRPLARGAEVLGEMARYFHGILLLDEECGQALLVDGDGAREGDAASLGARFLRGGADLGLAAGARLESPEAAGAWAAAWRGGTWLAELGPPSELAALAREALRGDVDELLDRLWERFLSGSSSRQA